MRIEIMAKPYWTAAEEQDAVAALAAGCDQHEFFLKVGRTKDAAKKHLSYINRKDQLNVSRRARDADIRHGRCEPRTSRYTKLHQDAVEPRVTPTREMVLDAERRLNAPRTLTQAILHDPPPGYSALDRRQESCEGGTTMLLPPVVPQSFLKYAGNNGRWMGGVKCK
jgi:hypothetical protein